LHAAIIKITRHHRRELRSSGLLHNEWWSACCVIDQQSAVLIYMAVETWHHTHTLLMSFMWPNNQRLRLYTNILLSTVGRT